MPSPRAAATNTNNKSKKMKKKKGNPLYFGGILDRETIRSSQASSAVRLRKQKQEERLSTRRQLSTTATTTILDLDRPRLEAAVQALVHSSTNEEDPLQILSRAGNVAAPFWRDMIQTDTEKACAVVQAILKRLAQSSSSASSSTSTSTALSLLIVLAAKEASPVQSDDSYYGAAPLRWGDLFLDVAAILLKLWNNSNNNSNNIQSTAWSAFMGMLVAQDATAWTSRILKHGSDNHIWPRLVAALPNTLHICAALVHYDTSVWGRFFLQHLTPAMLAQMLTTNNQDDTALVETAWIIEGLARREPASVQYLLQDTALLPNMVALLSQQQQQQQQSLSPRVALPLWRAIGHFAVANQGQYVTYLLESQQPALIQAALQILQQQTLTTTVRVEVLATMACLLVDAGMPEHVATTVALSPWLPALFETFVSSSFDVQRQALHTIVLALAPPPANTTTKLLDGSSHHSNHGATPWSQEPFTLPTILQQCLHMHDANVEPLRRLMQTILDVLQRPDAETRVHALRLLYLLLQHASPKARTAWLELSNGVQCLQDFLVQANAPEMVTDLAARILDDFFDNDEDITSDEEHAHQDFEPLPASLSSWFTTGSPLAASSSSATAAATTTTPSRPATVSRAVSDTRGPAGRGRGRVLPAWLARQKSA